MLDTTAPWSIAALAAHLDRPASLAVLAGKGTHRQVRPTLAGAHLADVSDPQHRALAAAATLGRVERGTGDGRAPLAVLKAAARKGLLTLVMRPGRRFDVNHGVITPAGKRELARLDGQQTADRARSERLAKLAA